MVKVLKTNDTEDKEQGRVAFVDAIINSATALKANPALGGSSHLQDVNDVLGEAKGFTKFDKAKGDDDYIDHNNNNKGNKVPHTKVTLRFKSRSFNPTDAGTLEAHLLKTFPNITFGDFKKPDGKTRILIHVNL